MEPIRSGLRRIMSDFLKVQPPEEAALLAWPVVCGAEVAARTKAVSFSDGQLIVEVPDANWRHQLADFAPRYLSGFAELVGPVVKVVRFQVGRPGDRGIVTGSSGHRVIGSSEKQQP